MGKRKGKKKLKKICDSPFLPNSSHLSRYIFMFGKLPYPIQTEGKKNETFTFID